MLCYIIGAHLDFSVNCNVLVYDGLLYNGLRVFVASGQCIEKRVSPGRFLITDVHLIERTGLILQSD